MRGGAAAHGAAGVAVRIGVLAYVATLVVVPLAALATAGLRRGAGALWEAITVPATADALALTLWTAALVAALNALLGTATAWILVRYRFPGRTLLSAIVDLPFAIPTLVAGITLVLVFGPDAAFGRWLDARGMRVAFATPGIVLALLLVTLPLVVRAVEPVLVELDAAEEEAALTLGAGNLLTFRRVILPALVPSVTFGALQSFARAIAEFGSVVVVSGNIPHQTLTAPVLIFGEVESGRPAVAAAVSLVLLGVALGLSLFTWKLRRTGAVSRV
jgi:sulfate/thiosulfate transport system permease protein